MSLATGTRLGAYEIDLHPDGQRVAAFTASPNTEEWKRDHVTLIFNFFDELRRLAPPASR